MFEVFVQSLNGTTKNLRYNGMALCVQTLNIANSQFVWATASRRPRVLRPQLFVQCKTQNLLSNTSKSQNRKKILTIGIQVFPDENIIWQKFAENCTNF